MLTISGIIAEKGAIAAMLLRQVARFLIAKKKIIKKISNRCYAASPGLLLTHKNGGGLFMRHKSYYCVLRPDAS
jgi:hypothetical protein